jgi:hypothetical protein
VSQQVQRRDLARFLRFMRAEEHTDRRPAWTPRLSSAFQHHPQSTLTAQGRRAWSDRMIIRILAQLKTVAKAPELIGIPWAELPAPLPDRFRRGGADAGLGPVER